MRLTLVGSGADTGVPVIGHYDGAGCACEDAIQHPTGFHARNVASLLITLRCQDGDPDLSRGEATDEKQDCATTASSTNTNSTPGQSSTSPTAKRSHADFTSPLYNTLHGERVYHLLVDSGKTMRDAYFRVMTRENLRSVDSLFLTSGKPSSMAGVDDLRDLQSMSSVGHGEWLIHHYIPTFVLPQTKAALEGTVKYIIRNSIDMGSSCSSKEAYTAAWEKIKHARASERQTAWNNIGIRRSTALQLLTVPDAAPEKVYVPPCGPNVPVYTLPLRSGEGGQDASLGLAFGRGIAFRSHQEKVVPNASCVVYLSDVFQVPQTTLFFLKDLVVIDILIVDCLHGAGKISNAHMCVDQVAELVCTLRPRRVVTTGMSCDISMLSGKREMEEALRRRVEAAAMRQIQIDVGYDGLVMEIPL